MFKSALIRLVALSLISLLAEALLPEKGVSSSARKVISVLVLASVLMPLLGEI